MRELSFRVSSVIAVTSALAIVEIALLVLCGVTRVALVEFCFSCATLGFVAACVRTVGGARSGRTLFGMPVALLGAACFAVQLVINVISVVLGDASEPVAYVVSGVILLGGIALFATTQSALRHAEAVETAQEARTAYMDGVCRRLLVLEARSEGKLAGAIAVLGRELRLCSPVSTAETTELEKLIDRELDRLEAIVSDPAKHGLEEGLRHCEELSRLSRLRDRAARS